MPSLNRPNKNSSRQLENYSENWNQHAMKSQDLLSRARAILNGEREPSKDNVIRIDARLHDSP